MVKLLTIINFMTMIIGFIVAPLSLKFLNEFKWENHAHIVSKAVSSYFNYDFEFHGKLAFLIQAISFVAIFSFLATLVTVISRLLSFNLYAHAEKDSCLVTIFNKTIQNTMEQSLIFFPLLGHWIFTIAQKSDTRLSVILVVAFLISRIALVLGLTFQTITGLKLFRNYANAMILSLYLILVSRNFGCSQVNAQIFQYLKF